MIDQLTMLQAELERTLPEHLELLRQMVRINSFTANPEGVFKMGRLAAGAFAPLGFTAEFVHAANPLFGDHLILTHSAEIPDAPTIGLTAHLDTVYQAAEEEQNDFYWREVGDRIYGPGTFDIKGGIVMIRLILAALQACQPELFNRVNWMVLLNSAEEEFVSDFGELLQTRLRGPRTLANLVFEGAGVDTVRQSYSVVVARKGMARYRIEVDGRGSHAGTGHERGASAIVQLADVITRIASYTDYGRELTFNVGTINGGTVLNRVPHFASSFVEMRAFDSAVFAEGLQKMVALNDLSTVQSVSGDFGARVHIDVLGQWEPWSRNDKTDALFAHWQAVAPQLGLTVEPEARGGLSDGNWSWKQIPTIDGLGPAGGNAHCSERSEDGSKDQEYVLPASFVPQALLNVGGIMRLLAEDEASHE